MGRLVEALGDRDREVRAAAARSLGLIGPAAAAAAPALALLVQNYRFPENNVALAAAWALGEIGAVSEGVVYFLSQAAAYGPEDVQLSAIEALGKLGPPAAEAAFTLAAYLSERETPRGKASQEAVLRMGPAAAPYLRDRLKTYLEREDPKSALAVADVLLKLGVSPAPTVFEFALSLPPDRLVGFGSFFSYPGGLDFLVSQLDSHDEGHQLASVAFLFGLSWMLSTRKEEAEAVLLTQSAANGLIKALSSPYPQVRECACSLLGYLSSMASTVVPALVDALNDEELEVRLAAIMALGDIGVGAEGAVPRLIEVAMGNDPLLALQAVITLGKIGPGARRAAPHLVLVLQFSPFAFLRWAAADALGEIGLVDARVATALIQALKSPWPPVRKSAAIALGKLNVVEAVPQLLAVLAEDAGAEARMGAAQALGLLRAQEATEALMHILESAPPPQPEWSKVAEIIRIEAGPEFIITSWTALQIAAAEALGRIGDPRAINVLVRTLEGPNLWLSNAAAKALAEFGPLAVPAVPGIVMLHQKAMEFQVRLASVEAMEAIGFAAVPSLIEALRSPDRKVYRAAERLLWVALSDRVPLEVVPDLFRVLELPYWASSAKSAAQWALSRVGPEALPLIREHLRHPDLKVREAVYEALAALGPAAAEAVDDLVALVAEQRRAPTGPAVVKALVRIGVVNDRVLDALIEALLDFSSEASPVREEAWRGLKALNVLPLVADRIVTSLTHRLEGSAVGHWRAMAIKLLAQLGEKAQSTLPLVRQALTQDRDLYVREAAARALPRLTPGDPETTLALVRALGDRITEVADAAEHALRQMTWVDGSVLIEAFAAETNPASMRERVGRVLSARKITEAIPILMHVLQDPRSNARAIAAETLGELQAAEALPLLVQGLHKSQDAKVQAAAARAVGRLGRVAFLAVPLLVDLLQHREAEVRNAAAAALGHILAGAGSCGN